MRRRARAQGMAMGHLGAPFALLLIGFTACETPNEPDASTDIDHRAAVLAPATVVELEIFPGHVESTVYDINNAGVMVGYSSPVASFVSGLPVRWNRSGEIESLGAPAFTGFASAINDRGDIAGTVVDHDGLWHAAVWMGDGEMLVLGALGGEESGALGINNIGEVVGFASTQPGQRWPYLAFLWTRQDGMRALPTVGGSAATAYDINDLGQIVGSSEVIAGQVRPLVAALWDRGGSVTNVGTLGGPFAHLNSINSFGVAVGFANPFPDEFFPAHAMVWSEPGGLADLGTIRGWYANATDITDGGLILGSDQTEARDLVAFMWTRESGFELLPPTDGPISAANAVNEAGEVAGFGSTPEGHRRAVRWTLALPPAPPVAAIDNVIAGIDNAVSAGGLAEALSTGLIARLEAAARQAAANRPAAAVRLLEAFVQQVEAWVAAAVVDMSVADPILTGVRAAIAALEV